MERLRQLVVLLLIALLVAPAAAREPTRMAVPEVTLAGLPLEARNTLDLIKRGGPYPYRKDGVEFQNRERRLPIWPAGHYREYTVALPGARDRGPRRIIASRAGDFYYTDDHYRSFRRIRE